jgi:hypothetical protein
VHCIARALHRTYVRIASRISIASYQHRSQHAASHVRYCTHACTVSRIASHACLPRTHRALHCNALLS